MRRMFGGLEMCGEKVRAGTLCASELKQLLAGETISVLKIGWSDDVVVCKATVKAGGWIGGADTAAVLRGYIHLSRRDQTQKKCGYHNAFRKNMRG